MLLDEAPATLLQATIGSFHISPDKQAVSRINESLATLQQARDLRVREAESSLKKLSRTLTSLKNSHAETLATHSAADHASEIATLDTQKFRIAKTASDLEIESERLSSQLAELQASLQELEMQGVEGGDNERSGLMDDETTLRLKVLRGLGMEPGKDGGQVDYSKAVVRNGSGLHVVALDNKFSRFFYTNYLWSVL